MREAQKRENVAKGGCKSLPATEGVHGCPGLTCSMTTASLSEPAACRRSTNCLM